MFNNKTGQYAFIAAKWRILEQVARFLLDTETDNILVHWGQRYIKWPGGAIAYLIPAKPNGEDHLRGLRLNGAWFISKGIDDLCVPSSMIVYTLTRAAGPDFKTWYSYL